jgi:hypothetical protein
MGILFINVQLSVEVKDNLLIAHTIFENSTSNTIHLDGLTLGVNNDLRRNVFAIVDQKGKKISYTGPMIKRHVSPGEFVSLKTGENIATSFVLNNAYQLQKGKTYTVEYNAYNPENLNEDDPLIKMVSNKVEILYQ